MPLIAGIGFMGFAPSTTAYLVAAQNADERHGVPLIKFEFSSGAHNNAEKGAIQYGVGNTERARCGQDARPCTAASYVGIRS